MKTIKGICMVCGCTEADACEDGCGWANRKQTLCTACVNLTGQERAEKQDLNLADLARRVAMLQDERVELSLRMDVIRANAKPVPGGAFKRSRRQMPRYPKAVRS